LHPSPQFPGVIAPRFEAPVLRRRRQFAEFGGTFQQVADGKSETWLVKPFQHPATAAPGRFADRSLRRADAGFPMLQAFQYGQAESLDE